MDVDVLQYLKLTAKAITTTELFTILSNLNHMTKYSDSIVVNSLALSDIMLWINNNYV